MLQCPSCRAAVELTWGRYLRAPDGGFPCPACGIRLIQRPRRWHWAALACLFALGAALTFPGWHSFGKASLAVAYVCGAIASVLGAKWLESRFSVLGRQPGDRRLDFNGPALSRRGRRRLRPARAPSPGICRLRLLAAWPSGLKSGARGARGSREGTRSKVGGPSALGPALQSAGPSPAGTTRLPPTSSACADGNAAVGRPPAWRSRLYIPPSGMASSGAMGKRAMIA